MSSEPEFKVPSWAGPAPTGLHLDVVKNGTLLQKLLLDEKNCYIFGRAKESCDFPLPHQSCSRQHAALVYHKHLKRPFLIDMGSTHGTFIGSMRLEAHKPTQVPLDSTLSFGASTRTYILRERPPVILPLITDNEGDEEGTEPGGTLLGLPELDNELDDLTQFNTAHNRQISMVGIPETEISHKRKQHPQSISFADEEEIINPEDIDPSVGKFRNMVQTTIIPTKKIKLSADAQAISPTSLGKFSKFKQPLSSPTALYADTPPPSATSPSAVGGYSGSTFFAKTISAAPPVANPTDIKDKVEQVAKPSRVDWSAAQANVAMPSLFSSDEPRKKKYAKEAWPGKKPAHLLV